MAPKIVIYKDARIALTRTPGRRAASWLIISACLAAMMLLWGVPLPWWVFAIVIAVPFATLIGLGNHWAGQDEHAREEAAKAARAAKSPKPRRPAKKRTQHH